MPNKAHELNLKSGSLVGLARIEWEHISLQLNWHSKYQCDLQKGETLKHFSFFSVLSAVLTTAFTIRTAEHKRNIFVSQ